MKRKKYKRRLLKKKKRKEKNTIIFKFIFKLSKTIYNKCKG